MLQMVLQHEYQHNETILPTLQFRKGTHGQAPWAFSPAEGEPKADRTHEMVRFPGGVVRIGTDDRTASDDGERPLHRVRPVPFRIDRDPVTNSRSWRKADAKPELWFEIGGNWLRVSGVEAPKYWLRRGGRGSWTALDPSIRGKRSATSTTTRPKRGRGSSGNECLPRAEWETAASWDSARGMKASIGTEYEALRGGCWATRPGAIRNTFRDWDCPIRRLIFSGLGCARHG